MDWNEQVIAEFREGKPTVMEKFDLRWLAVLHHKGAKSGLPRETPLVCFDFRKQLYVAASYAGAPQNPAWYHNLKAHPEIEIERWEMGQLKRYTVTARELSDEEREPVWDRITKGAPAFAEYQAKAERTIPVMALDRHS